MARDDDSPMTSVVAEVLAGGGAMGALMRSLDWTATPLGPVESWPQSLRTSVSICLTSRFPMLIWWGPELVMLLQRAMWRGEMVRGEQFLTRAAATGQDITVLANAAPLCEPDGAIVGAVGVFQDITALKDLERAREEFLSSASHDLKAPLTSIRGQAQLAQRRLSRIDAPETAAVARQLALIDAGHGADACPHQRVGGRDAHGFGRGARPRPAHGRPGRAGARRGGAADRSHHTPHRGGHCPTGVGDRRRRGPDRTRGD